MITKVFSVYDSKALCFGVPFFMSSVGSAVRAFGDLSNDPQSILSKHPSDFVLYQIGVFDDSKAIFENISPHVHLGIGADFLLQERSRSQVQPVGLDNFVKEAVSRPLAVNEELVNGK